MHKPNKTMHILFNKNLDLLYISFALRVFGLSLISIFIPLFLLTNGIDLKHIFIYIIYTYIANLISVFFSYFSIKRLGTAITISISMIAILFFFFLLYTYKQFFWPLPLIGGMLGFSSAMFWQAFNLDFSFESDKKHRGVEFGFLKSIAMFLSILAPFLGSILIESLGFKVVFLIVSFILFFATIFLFKIPKKDINFKKSEFKLNRFINKKQIKYYLLFFSEGVRNIAVTFVWPLFLFFIFKEFISLGFLASIGTFAMAITSIKIGSFVDHKKIKNIKG